MHAKFYTDMKQKCLRNSVFCVFLILGCLLISSRAEAKNDSIQISILTCSPGNEIYELFGHTAIRYHNISKNEDVVFNYGMFNFNTPHFVLRYIKGETDYQLGINDYNDFISEYTMRNSSVYEQVLNLTPAEKRAFYWALTKNYQPEHRVYRYNFFYDNCSTRPRDKVENLVKGKVDYQLDDRVQTFRSIVHEFTKGHPWSQFGIDLCLGSQADQSITSREKMFAPYYLKDALDKAVVETGKDSIHNLVLSSGFLFKSNPNISVENGFPLTPIQCGVILFIVVIGVCLYEFKKNKIYWIVDVVIFGAAGIGGCILMFLACFSVHPAVSPNFVLFVLHPFHLIGVACMVWCLKHNRRDYYSVANFIILTLFLFSTEVIPQQFDKAVILITLSLLIRSGMYIYFSIIKKIK